MYIRSAILLLLINNTRSLILKNVNTPKVSTRLFSKKNINSSSKYLDITKLKESIMETSSLMKCNYKPRSENQQKYVDNLNDPNISVVFGIGPAGCGKTLFACISAINSLKRGDVSKIILTRPIVSVQEEIGFLPGDIASKMDPWLKPLFDIFLENYTQKELDKMIGDGVIEISPLGFMRGRTFKETFVICDELQNSTPNQMLMLLTRAGNGCKMVVTGDLKQSDLMVKNGLLDFMEKYKTRTRDYSNIRLIEMTSKDVERSELVKNILDLYNNENHNVSTIKPNTLLASGTTRSSLLSRDPIDWDWNDKWSKKKE